MCHETLCQSQLSSPWQHTRYGEVVSDVSMSVVSWRRAYVVKCLRLKPCLSLAGEIKSLIEGKMSPSRTLAAGYNSEMGL